MSGNDLRSFTTDYYQQFAEALLAFDSGSLTDVQAVIDTVRVAGGTLYVAGNGGSAAIADHIVCDCSKGTFVEGQPPFRVVALTSNGPILTALGNDVSYDEIFSKQLEYFMTEKDALLVVSSSGNSPNVVKACEFANDKGVPTIAFVGFKGGKLKDTARHVVHVAVDNYGIVEDMHMSFIHVLTQYMTARAKA